MADKNQLTPVEAEQLAEKIYAYLERSNEEIKQIGFQRADGLTSYRHKWSAMNAYAKRQNKLSIGLLKLISANCVGPTGEKFDLDLRDEYPGRSYMELIKEGIGERV